MVATCPFITRFIVLLGLATISACCFSQPAQPDPQKWAIEFSKKDYHVSESFKKLDSTLDHIDSLHSFQFLNELAEKGNSGDDYFQARFKCLKARVIYNKNVYYEFYQARKAVNLDQVKQQVMKLLSSAMDIAYRSEDDYLIAFVSYAYSSTVYWFGEYSIALMYAKNSIDLYEKLSYPVLPERYQFLSELLFKVREYDECIRYGKKAVATWRRSPKEYKQFTVSSMNTVALGYHRQKLNDSALIFYNQALELAKQIKDTVWVGIVSGNMGQLFYTQGKYDTAYKLLKLDYESSKRAGYYDNASNSLQWAARTDLAMDHKTAALAEVREALKLLSVWPDANYLRNAYYTSMQIFREVGAYDSAFYYNSLYSRINDSLEKVVATSSLVIAKARLNDEASRYNIQNLNRDEQSQLLLRNIIIAGVVILSLFALLMVNRKRLKTRIKMEKVEQEKILIEQEINSARDQLKMFTENIVEKTNLIEKLESQIKGEDATSEQYTIVSELSEQTILTEEDWNKFRSLFEKIYPGFFIKLKEKFPDITLAEQRMAALTRLRLTTKQIASMLGISVDSVHKSRQRLRMRFQVGTDTNLDELVANL